MSGVPICVEIGCQSVDTTDTRFIVSYVADKVEGGNFCRKDVWSVHNMADTIRSVEGDIPDNLEGRVEDRAYENAEDHAERFCKNGIRVEMCGLPWLKYKARYVSSGMEDFVQEAKDTDVESVSINVKMQHYAAERGMAVRSLFTIKYTANVKEGRPFGRRTCGRYYGDEEVAHADPAESAKMESAFSEVDSVASRLRSAGCRVYVNGKAYEPNVTIA